MIDLTLQHVVMRLCAVVLIASVHGYAVAATAVLLGDAGPRHDGRLGISPLRHIDLVGGLVAVLFTAGWIRPVAIDAARLRPGRAGLVAVVLLSAAATLGLAALLRLVRPAVLSALPDTEASAFFVLVETITQLCVSFTLFNLLPLPPLTGAHLLAAVQPRRQAMIRRAGSYIAVPLALLIATGQVGRLLAPGEAVLTRIIQGD